MTDEALPDAPEYDEALNDAGNEGDDDELGDDYRLNLEHENNAKITILREGASEDGTCASFQFENESHTLGNALTWIILKNPMVELCAYTIPHPSEPLMNLRVQTYGEISAKEALMKGLGDLRDLCDVVTEKFTTARNEFNAKKGVTA